MSVKKTESTVPTLHKKSTCTATISTPNEEELGCIVTDLRKPCTAPTGQSLETASEANVPLSSVWKTSQTRLLDETSNLELLKQLKFQHQYLKYCQEQGKVNKNVELTKFISSWVLSSEALLPNSSLYDMVLQPNSQQPLRENEKSSRFTMPRRISREQGKPHKAKSQPLLATLTENRNKTHHLTNSKSIGRFISAKGPPPSAGSSQATIKLQKNLNPRSEKLAFSQAERSSNNARASKSCVTNFSRTQKPKRSISSSSGRSSKIPQRDFVDPFPGKVKITKSSFKRLSSIPAVIGVPSALITYADKQQLQRGFKNAMLGAKKEKSAPTSPNMKRYTPLGENRSGKPQSRKLKSDYSPTRVIKSEKASLSSHFQTMDSFKKADESFLSTVSTAFSGLFRKPNFQELDDLSLKFTISHETLESVQLPATTGRDNNVGEFWLGCDYETERSEYEKPTGEVSFSDPIAIVITVSSTDLPETNHLKV
ncbi:hypothetical protein Ocin01_14963 [Orchesella cincta]|uniref:Uncharacterized protein n=1 Tax=Orchesella cincta TaxID=48709 RepID=A0A1D2MFC6_ORCCI|nr:hypothetical protein Ocin01_14963 [Orchesella cincta]